ncbi:MAG: hypothetical protein H6945_14795 [Zoogloeaceae bacterium]|nr:hypothetical protein [Rhodocyclaceae bacterium]MCP5237001.1 hypothetical protein [Zoogloeaceae bacterium]
MIESDLQQGTRASAPDLDWSQVRETVLMLQLAAAQIEAAMREGNSSVDVLTNSFTTLAGNMRKIGCTAAELPDTPQTGPIKAQLTAQAEEAGQMVHSSIVAFQFYDKLAQRLAHVCHSLEALGSLVADKGRLYNPSEWVGLQEKIRSRYSTAEEHDMFQAVMRGVGVQQALDEYLASAGSSGESVELF